MNDFIHIPLIRVVDPLTFSHGGNWNQQGRMPLWCG